MLSLQDVTVVHSSVMWTVMQQSVPAAYFTPYEVRTISLFLSDVNHMHSSVMWTDMHQSVPVTRVYWKHGYYCPCFKNWILWDAILDTAWPNKYGTMFDCLMDKSKSNKFN